LKVTIADVAKKAGVSKTTVSRILNNKFDHTTEETRKRVLKVIEELDYQPNALAKGLKSMKTNVIGIMLSNLKNPFWSSVLEGVEDTCNDLGFNLMICNSDENPQTEERYIKEFQTRQLDGIVINPTVRNVELYHKIVSTNYPLVIMNRRIEDLDTVQVVMNNVKGAYLAVNHLFECGRKNIAVFVYGNPLVSTWQERVEGYKLALTKRGIPESEARIQELDTNSRDIRTIVKEFLDKYPDTDAILSTNNMITLNLIDAIKDLGIQIPNEIAIVGYDETVWAKHLEPPLTTIYQPGYKMGQVAAETLIHSIKKGEKMEKEIILLEPELIIRRSCGATN